MTDKTWNDRTQNWEKDGKPYTYRVSWVDTDGDRVHATFDDVDEGYSFYQDRLKDPTTTSPTWDHIPPGE